MGCPGKAMLEGQWDRGTVGQWDREREREGGVCHTMVAIENATRRANRAHDCPTKWHLCLPSCVCRIRIQHARVATTVCGQLHKAEDNERMERERGGEVERVIILSSFVADQSKMHTLKADM